MVFLFFQAEDGIRDLVRSRGLGDVYKRQLWNRLIFMKMPPDFIARFRSLNPKTNWYGSCTLPVSYTHLTLPTSDLV